MRSNSRRKDRDRALDVRLVAWASLVALTAWSGSAAADGVNAMAGPLLGIAWGGGKPSRPVVGGEGGVGWGPERLNVGLVVDKHETFGYVELDPWFYVGASLGVGVGTESGVHGIIGVWEGLPLNDPCRGTLVTLSVGYRWRGVHEVYVAPKIGTASICPDL